MPNVMEVLEERLPNMRLSNVVQTGFINVAMTKLLSEYSPVVTFYTPATFNPFEGNEKVKVITDKPHTVAAVTSGTIDVLVLNGLQSYTEVKLALCAWLVNVRRNGLIVITGTDTTELQQSITDTLAMIDLDAFRIELFDDFTVITPIK